MSACETNSPLVINQGLTPICLKMSILKVWILAISFVSFGTAVADDQPQGQADGAQGNHTNQYSALASELIEAYQPRPGPPGAPQPAALLPPGLLPQHLDKKYRSAWEELLLARVTEPLDLKVAYMGSRIYQALQHLADTKSVPVLAKAFRQTTGKEVDQHRVIPVQDQILTVLILICNTDSLETILASLDSADERYGDREPERYYDKTLREMTFSAMMQPDLPPKPEFRESIERANKWQGLVQAYQSPGLSRKNREFLDKAKSENRERSGLD